MSKNPVEKLSGYVIVTGGSSGIGLELVKRAAADGCDVLIVADRDLETGAAAAREAGARSVDTLETDLATEHGIDAVMERVGARPVDALIANAGAGQAGRFLDTPWRDIKKTVDTNVTGTISLIHKIGGAMRDRNAGRILVTGSIVADMPGTFNLTYNSTKAFIVDFTVGLAEELRDSAVVVTCLLPGATDTEFFEKADMENASIHKAMLADPAKVAKDGYEALLKGEVKEVSGLLNKVQYLFADILPDGLVAKMHRKMASDKDGDRPPRGSPGADRPV